MYKVIQAFHDLTDSTAVKGGAVYHKYEVGDEYPRSGKEASKERIAELLGVDNKQGAPLIEEVKAKKTARKAVKKGGE